MMNEEDIQARPFCSCGCTTTKVSSWPEFRQNLPLSLLRELNIGEILIFYCPACLFAYQRLRLYANSRIQWQRIQHHFLISTEPIRIFSATYNQSFPAQELRRLHLRGIVEYCMRIDEPNENCSVCLEHFKVRDHCSQLLALTSFIKLVCDRGLCSKDLAHFAEILFDIYGDSEEYCFSW